MPLGNVGLPLVHLLSDPDISHIRFLIDGERLFHSMNSYLYLIILWVAGGKSLKSQTWVHDAFHSDILCVSPTKSDDFIADGSDHWHKHYSRNNANQQRRSPNESKYRYCHHHYH